MARFNLRVRTDVHTRWAKAAELSGVSLSEFVRDAVEAWIELHAPEVSDVPHPVLDGDKVTAQGPAGDRRGLDNAKVLVGAKPDRQLRAREPVPHGRGSCPMSVPRGVKCKVCGKPH